MIKKFICVLIFIIISALAFSCGQTKKSDNSGNLTIIHMNDTHGRDEEEIIITKGDNPLPTFFNIFFIRIPPNISSIYLCCNHSSINNYASQNIMLSFFAILLVFVYNFVGYFRVLFKILHFH